MFAILGNIYAMFLIYAKSVVLCQKDVIVNVYNKKKKR